MHCNFQGGLPIWEDDTFFMARFSYFFIIVDNQKLYFAVKNFYKESNFWNKILVL